METEFLGFFVVLYGEIKPDTFGDWFDKEKYADHDHNRRGVGAHPEKYHQPPALTHELAQLPLQPSAPLELDGVHTIAEQAEKAAVYAGSIGGTATTAPASAAAGGAGGAGGAGAEGADGAGVSIGFTALETSLRSRALARSRTIATDLRRDLLALHTHYGAEAAAGGSL